MVLGVSSILLFKQRTVKDLISLLIELNIKHVDLFLIPPYLSIDNIDEIASEIRDAVSDVKFTIKAPSFSENLASILREIRETTMREYIETIEIAHRVGALGVIIKPGMMFHTEKKCKDEILGVFTESIRKIADKASHYGIKLLLENYYYPYEILRRAESFTYIYELINDYNNVGFALNIPHLLESRSSVDFLIRNCSGDVLNKIELIYLGLRPSPWENSTYIQSITHSYYEFVKIYKVVKPEYIVAASIDPTITRLLIDYLRDVL